MKSHRFLVSATLFLMALGAVAYSQQAPKRSLTVGTFPQRTAQRNTGYTILPCGDRLFMLNDAGKPPAGDTAGAAAAVYKLMATFSGSGSGAEGLHCAIAGSRTAVGTPAGLFVMQGNTPGEPVLKLPVTAVAALGGEIIAGTPAGLYILKNGTPDRVAALGKRAVTALAVDSDNAVWIGLESGLARLDPIRGAVTEFSKGTSGADGLLHENVRSLFVDEKGTLWIGTPAGLSKFDRYGAWDYVTGKHGGLPYEDVTAITGGNGILWVGTTIGACRYDGKEWHYFQGPQYLDDDHVLDIAVQIHGVAWIATPAGATRVEYTPMTLEKKAEFFEDLSRSRHNRYGLFSGCRLTEPGVAASCTPTTNDNDGLWTGMYVAAECYRFGATGDPEAKQFARESLNSMMLLEKVNGLPGFVSRSFAKPDDPHGGGEWDHISEDGQWRWKGDTSSDEIDGHMYAYSVYYDVCADEEEKKEIADVVDRIMSYIVDNDFYLVDVDGEATTWGRWNPEVWEGEGFFLRGLNSLEILSYLKTAEHITGNPKFTEAYRYLIKEHGYAKNMVKQKLSHLQIWNHSDDELAFLAYYPLLKYETVPFLLKYFNKSLERSWQIERPEANPLFNFVYASAFDGDFDLEESVEMLKRVPLTGIRWAHRNSHRADIEIDRSKGRFQELQSKKMLPFDERTLHLWNENPFRLDRPTGNNWEQPGAFYLLPYWMGRYYGFIVEE